MEKHYPPRERRTARRILAENLRLIRLERHMAQEALADLVGLDRSYLGAVERGERNVGIDNVEKMAEALGLSVGRLLTETDTTQMARHLLEAIRERIREEGAVYEAKAAALYERRLGAKGFGGGQKKRKGIRPGDGPPTKLTKNGSGRRGYTRRITT